MPQYLSGNVSSGCDFQAGRDHFKGTPMLVFDKVSDESFACFCVELIAGIADTGAIRDEFLCIMDAQFCKFWSWLAVTE